MTQHMSVALWCVVAAGLLPYVATFIAKADKTFNNRDPRAWLAKQTGYQQRANAAQYNSFEAFPLFAAGVLVAQYLQAPQAQIDTLALVFVAARIAFIALYIGNRPTLRSLVWCVGFGSVLGLFVIAA